MRLALYQPDIPQNAGSILRLAACLGVAVDIIEPCGFVLDDRRLKRAAMDYLGQAEIRRFVSWDAYVRTPRAGRLVLLSTKARLPYHRFAFAAEDLLLLGRELAGVPPEVAQAADERVLIPMQPNLRSLNVALAAALALGEALRQTGLLPKDEA